MSALARTWLPRTVLDGPHLSAGLAADLAQWSAQWLAGRPVHAAHASEEEASDAAPVRSMTAAGKRRLVEMALAIDLATLVLSPADHRLIDALAETMLADLAARLGAGETDREESALSVTIASEAGDLARLRIGAQHLIEKVRSALPRPHPRKRAPLQRRGIAIAHSTVTVAAVLGRASLTVGDIDGLSEGDVIVLDRTIGTSAELQIAASCQPIARGALRAEGGRPALQL
jgi:flagellar motor switch/type III secretory pathway protein FliN